MNFTTYVARRTLLAALAIYLVLTATFAVVAFTPNTNLGGAVANMQRQGASDAEVQEFVTEYKEKRGLDEPLLERYTGWLVDVSTFDFGYSWAMREPVSKVLWPAIQRTAFYAIPAVLLAVLVGTLLGSLSGALPESVPDWAVRVGGYAVVGVPGFVMAFVALHEFAGSYDWIHLLTWASSPFYNHGYVYNPNRGLWPTSDPVRFLVPAVILALSLVGWQLRYVRTAYRGEAGRESVKLHEAKGAGRLRVARHVLRNAAIPIVSASISELLVIVLLNLYVIETVFGIEGVAALNMIGVRTRDMPLIVATSLALAVAGILGSYVQDLLYGVLDPRVSTE